MNDVYYFLPVAQQWSALGWLYVWKTYKCQGFDSVREKYCQEKVAKKCLLLAVYLHPYDYFVAAG